MLPPFVTAPQLIVLAAISPVLVYYLAVKLVILTCTCSGAFLKWLWKSKCCVYTRKGLNM